MSKPNVDLDALSIDQMLDLKDALEAKLLEIAKTETAPMAERLKRLQTYLPDEKPAPRRAKKTAKKPAEKPAQSKPSARAPAKAASAAEPKAARKPTKKSKVPPKYRDPKTGKTWSGRGMAPVWMRELEAAGRKRSDFAI